MMAPCLRCGVDHHAAGVALLDWAPCVGADPSALKAPKPCPVCVQAPVVLHAGDRDRVRVVMRCPGTPDLPLGHRGVEVRAEEAVAAGDATVMACLLANRWNNAATNGGGPGGVGPGQLRALHLFAGGGGSVLAGHLLGWTSVGCVEIEPYCRRVLRARGERLVGCDVQAFQGTAWQGKVDVVVAGTPCQDLSVSGKRTGLRGKRSGLFHQLMTPSANEDAAGTPNGAMQAMLSNDPCIRGTTPEEWARGVLSPEWTEHLMGWPRGWSGLPAKAAGRLAAARRRTRGRRRGPSPKAPGGGGTA